jgi:hypothetical protein
LFQVSQIFPFLHGQIVGCKGISGHAQKSDPEYFHCIIAKLSCPYFPAFASAACPLQIIPEFIAAFFDLLFIANLQPFADRVQIR